MPRLVDHLESPPDFGRTDLEFELTHNPIGRQSNNRDGYRAFKDAVSSCVRPVQYLLSGEVQLEVEWYIHERERYETDRSPDVDNILKPILDGISGPDGLLINDCQVQAIDCRWIDQAEESQSLFVRVRFMSDEWAPKKQLAFVHYGRSLCFPINLNLKPEGLLIVVNHVEKMLANSAEIEGLTGDYSLAKGVLPIQRLFHRSRLEPFQKIELADLKRQLEREIQRKKT